MAFVPVPKDLNVVKPKVMFNLTKRQLICFGSAAVVGLPLYFLLKEHVANSVAAISMIVIMVPFFLFAMYEKNDQPLDKLLWNVIQVCFLRQKKRPYMTNNFYAVVERQANLDKEVYEIVNKKKTHRRRKKAD